MCHRESRRNPDLLIFKYDVRTIKMAQRIKALFAKLDDPEFNPQDLHDGK